MKALSNEMLLETYQKAVEMKLENDFIQMLHAEMDRRKLKSQHSIRMDHSCL